MIVPLLVLAAAPAFAQVANEYRQFLGIDTRKLIWFLAQAQKLDPGQYKGSRDALLISLPGWYRLQPCLEGEEKHHEDSRYPGKIG